MTRSFPDVEEIGQKSDVVITTIQIGQKIPPQARPKKTSHDTSNAFRLHFKTLSDFYKHLKYLNTHVFKFAFHLFLSELVLINFSIYIVHS